MKVTCLLGSPRVSGNSASVAGRFLATAEDMGAEVQTFQLNALNYQGCQGCGACKTKLDDCILEDDLSPVLAAVRETDLLVLATPVYYLDVSSQMKGFIDRTYSFVKPDYLTNPNGSRLAKGKKLVWIQTQEGGEGSYAEIFQRYDFFFKFYGFAESRFIHVCGVGQDGGLEKRPDVFRQAEAAAREMCGI
jgi:multimeric flavodoxin WrbA